MKKFALISGLLFLVVFLWVNTFTKDESSFDLTYPPSTVSSASSAEVPDNQNESDLPTLSYPSVAAPRTYIIIASFSDQDLARKMAETYIAQYQAEIIVLPPTPRGNFRLSYGSYASSGEAMAALETVRHNGFPDAWILASR